MIRQEVFAQIVDSQKEQFLSQDLGLIRERIEGVPVEDSFATVITGLRRCGKSTLLRQIMSKKYSEVFYLHFDDFRLSGFVPDDWNRLGNEIAARKISTLFFDEIQIMPEWEKFVNSLISNDYRIFITGSNASMLSVELGTFLTGRHLSFELFPFSYSEYIDYTKQENTAAAVSNYLQHGGIPQYVNTNNLLVLNQLIDDILIRDIAIRHNIKDVNSLRQLSLFLMQNIGNPVAASKLVDVFGIKSATTILEYFSFLKDAYLFDFIPLFSPSTKVQARNPKKVYAGDLGLYTASSFSLSENLGPRFENLIYLHLRRFNKEIFYHKTDTGECDFIVMNKTQLKYLIQVCYEINNENFEREYNGLLNMMKLFKAEQGFIVTLNQKDTFNTGSGIIEMLPATEFLTSNF
jgi:predicted AAA+ superfamily ATPase